MLSWFSPWSSAVSWPPFLCSSSLLFPTLPISLLSWTLPDTSGFSLPHIHHESLLVIHAQEQPCSPFSHFLPSASSCHHRGGLGCLAHGESKDRLPPETAMEETIQQCLPCRRTGLSLDDLRSLWEVVLCTHRYRIKSDRATEKRLAVAAVSEEAYSWSKCCAWGCECVKSLRWLFQH